MARVLIHTIGFTQTTAADFFGRLRAARIERLVDVRRNNVSQLAGFAKRDDLEFFLREICGADYVHELRLAPVESDLKDYRNGKWPWSEYEARYLKMLRDHDVAKKVPRSLFEKRSVLLCSESTPEHCHRRLAAEYLRDAWGNVEIVHL